MEVKNKWDNDVISIHALREEGDLLLHSFQKGDGEFLSTPSARRATGVLSEKTTETEKFLSTPSARRATVSSCSSSGNLSRFLSTPSARRATGNTAALSVTTIFLSTPSARRATPQPYMHRCNFSYFYPRPPRGGRPLSTAWMEQTDTISIHALREEGDKDKDSFISIKPISIHALREEGDSKNRDKISIFKQIIQHSARI